MLFTALQNKIKVHEFNLLSLSLMVTTVTAGENTTEDSSSLGNSLREKDSDDSINESSIMMTSKASLVVPGIKVRILLTCS